MYDQQKSNDFFSQLFSVNELTGHQDAGLEMIDSCSYWDTEAGFQWEQKGSIFKGQDVAERLVLREVLYE